MKFHSHRTTVTVALLISLFAMDAFAQTSWTWQNVAPQGNNLTGVRALSSGTVVAVGVNGTVVRSTDVGESWKIVTTPTHNPLYAVDVLSDGVCIAVGYGGMILRSTDFGATWKAVGVGLTSKALNAVRLGSRRGSTSSGTGYIVGSMGTMLRTTDYGATWAVIASGGTTDLYAVAYDSAVVFVAGGIGTIRRSTDNGATWKKHTTGTTVTLNSIVADASSGVAVGEYDASGKSVILRMTNADTVWNRMTTNSVNTLAAVHFWSPAKGIAVGEFGTVIVSADSGKTWQLSSINNELMNITGVACMQDSMAINVGVHGMMFKTLTAGAGNTPWLQIHKGRAVTWYGLAVADRKHAVTAGVGGLVFQTNDGGANWVQRSSGATQFLDAAYCTHASVFAVGWYGAIYNSADSGTTWKFVMSGVSTSLQAVRFKDSVGCIVGQNGVILRGADWGATWKQQTSPIGTSYTFNDAAVLNADTTLVFGDKGYVLKTMNKGVTWTVSRVPDTTMTINSAAFINARTGVVVGSKGGIYRTADGGATWTKASAGTDPSTTYTSVSFATPDTGMATAYSGVLLRTYDGGATWVRLDAGTSNSLQAVRMIDAKTAFAAGDYGTILVTTDGGGGVMTAVEEHMQATAPVHLQLEQNFPNPFNPSTTIRYTLATRSHVRIVIVNILGQVVAELLDAEQSAGARAVVWNARAASGVYFYRIDVADAAHPERRFTETRKMILMR